MPPLHTSTLSGLPLLSRGKVRDIYAVDEDRLLIVQTDRISAFDVVMDQPIPDKGAVLTQMSHFWFTETAPLCANHLCAALPESVLGNAQDRAAIADRAMLVRRLRPLPIEAICRRYLIGSGWKDYLATGAVCGIALPPGLRLADRLPTPLFTPSTKAAQGAHDQNISYTHMAHLIGADLAHRVRATAIALFEHAAAFALKKDIIIADTKFEFAVDDDGALILIDEALTPDSSRFWRASDWRPGQNPDSYDKQILRDWLAGTDWNKHPPPPPIPPAIITATSTKYREIRTHLLP